MAKIKMRADLKDDAVVVKALITHPMETGRRRDTETKELVPAHFIQRLIAEHAGEKVFESWWGTGVSANPFISFSFTGAQKGDKIKLTWVDNLGQSDSIEKPIK